MTRGQITFFQGRAVGINRLDHAMACFTGTGKTGSFSLKKRFQDGVAGMHLVRLAKSLKSA